jgi:hypothetical protein
MRLVPGAFTVGLIGSTAPPRQVGDISIAIVLGVGDAAGARDQGLTLVHFSTQRKRFCGVWGEYKGCLGGVQEVLWRIRKRLGCISGQKWIRLSSTVEYCKPLPGMDPKVV